MSEINWTAIIVTLIITAGLCFIIRSCQHHETNREIRMIEAGYTYEQVPHSYHG